MPWDFDTMRHLGDSLFVLEFEVNFEPSRKVVLQGQMVYTKSPDEELIYFLGSVDVRVRILIVLLLYVFYNLINVLFFLKKTPEEASYLGLSMSSYALHDARIYLVSSYFKNTISKAVLLQLL